MMCEHYKSEEYRAKRSRNLLTGYLGISINGVKICDTIDGSWIIGSWIIRSESYMGMDIELKNEPGRNGGPYIQTIAYYKEYMLNRNFIATRRLA
jgi:hypothetical protein